jgi:hypothetical protein
MLQTLQQFFAIAYVILVQNKRNTYALFEELEAHLNPKGFALSNEHRKRIAFYTAQSALTNYWFSTLRGKKPTASETKLGLYLGAYTPITDDLMDNTGSTYQQLRTIAPDSSAEASMFNYLWEKMQPSLKTNTSFAYYFEKAHEAQNESLVQMEPTPLGLNQLREITFNKGAYATLLYRFLLQNEAKEGEVDAIYTLGSILQVMNDLFDIYKDYQNGAQTLVTKTADIHFVKKTLDELEAKLRSQFFTLDYPPRQKQKSWLAIMAIVTRGHIALNHYLDLQGNSAKIDIATYPRKPLIVDMEKLGNIWKNVIETSKASKSESL